MVLFLLHLFTYKRLPVFTELTNDVFGTLVKPLTRGSYRTHIGILIKGLLKVRGSYVRHMAQAAKKGALRTVNISKPALYHPKPFKGALYYAFSLKDP